MIRIIALTESGHQLAQKIQEALFQRADIWFKPKPFADKVQQAFSQGDRLIFICATGIVVRTLAPVLISKKRDPAVLVIDESGKFVIPLLSGHEGGANDWGNEIAALLDSQLVMTTAQTYIDPIYTVGMGCERNCPEVELQNLLSQCLQQTGLNIEQISSINSIDIKADEQGLISLAESLNKPYQTWRKEELASVESLLSTKSDYVYQVVGVYGVAESAALLAAQQQTGGKAELVLAKQKNAKATCSIARAY